MKDENSIFCLCSASSSSQGQLQSIGMTSEPLVESHEQSFDSEHLLKHSRCNNFISNGEINVVEGEQVDVWTTAGFLLFITRSQEAQEMWDDLMGSWDRVSCHRVDVIFCILAPIYKWFDELIWLYHHVKKYYKYNVISSRERG